MEKNDEEDLDVNKESFDKVIGKFKQSNKRNYDFITKSGPLYKDAIFSLVKRMIEEETFPKCFDDTVLNQIWKQKGEKSVLKNNRYIHTKNS